MNGIIVSNTGPIIALSLIDHLAILKSIFQETIISQSVHEEILQGGHLNIGLAQYKKATSLYYRLQIQSIRSITSVLDKGEASVIELAKQCHADFVLIDEKKGRKIARDVYNMNVIASARILVEAKNRGLIKNVSQALAEIKAKGYWIHDSIVNLAKEKAGER